MVRFLQDLGVVLDDVFFQDGINNLEKAKKIYEDGKMVKIIFFLNIAKRFSWQIEKHQKSDLSQLTPKLTSKFHKFSDVSRKVMFVKVQIFLLEFLSVVKRTH